MIDSIKRQQLALARIVDDDAALDVRLARKVGQPLREHPVEHRPRHLRKAREEMMVAERERGDAVVRIGDDAAAGRKLGHQHAMRIRLLAEARFDLAHRLGMALERHAERRGRCLARVVVRRGADAAEAEHDVAAREGVAQHVGETRAIVAEVLRVVEHDAARPERRDDVRQMLVRALAGEDLVADDQRADGARARLRTTRPRPRVRFRSEPESSASALARAALGTARCAPPNFSFLDLRQHAGERAVDQRLGFDQTRAIGAETLGEFFGGHATTPSGPGGW